MDKKGAFVPLQAWHSNHTKRPTKLMSPFIQTNWQWQSYSSWLILLSCHVVSHERARSNSVKCPNHTDCEEHSFTHYSFWQKELQEDTLMLIATKKGQNRRQTNSTRIRSAAVNHSLFFQPLITTVSSWEPGSTRCNTALQMGTNALLLGQQSFSCTSSIKTTQHIITFLAALVLVVVHLNMLLKFECGNLRSF